MNASQNFLCPHCRASLNVDELVILSAKSTKGEAGIVLFNEGLGDYTISTNKSFEIKEGQKYEFFCPVCNEKLFSDKHEDLSKIIFVDNHGTEYNVLFSRIAGEKSTYKIVGETMDIFGKDSSNYIDFMNLSEIT
jgi:uncharacterized protein YbaR (Trm112 family)